MTKAVEHTPGDFEQQVIQNLRLIEAQLVKSIRQCKDNMKIRYRQKFLLSCLYPLLPSSTLALRTMPVPATIEAYTHMSATGAAIYMASQ
jgi:hypothetical protein